MPTMAPKASTATADGLHLAAQIGTLPRGQIRHHGEMTQCAYSN
ncbi:hypothetical protein AQ1_01986 [alpha proteobacterium Q-1]|nr:hypothetical protein AQ1_01986 [alpha proteobacterium Q-1]